MSTRHAVPKLVRASWLQIPKSLITDIEALKDDLTISNGSYFAAVNAGRPTGDIPPEFVCYLETEDELWVPRNYEPLKGVKVNSGRNGQPVWAVTSVSPSGAKQFLRPWPHRIKLRGDQPPADSAMRRPGDKILSLACGKGKTVVSLHALCEKAPLRLPAIIVVHTQVLMDQWRARIREHCVMGLNRVGHIQGPVCDYRNTPFTVAMIQSLVQKEYPEEMYRYFRTAVFDECFVAGTLVDGRPIESLEIGDEVLSYDEDTGGMLRKKVVDTFSSQASELITVTFSNGRTVTGTPNHPVWIADVGWTPFGSLAVGNEVLFYDEKDFLPKRVRVDRVEVQKQGSNGGFGGLCPDGRVYNLEVEKTHTYTANGLVVHNCHRLGAPMFSIAGGQFLGERWGLSATHKRQDGNDVIFKMHCGPVAYTDLEQELQAKTWFIQTPVTVNMERYYMRYGPRARWGGHRSNQPNINWAKLLTDLSLDESRDELILHWVLKAARQGRKVLALGERVEQLKRLARLSRERGVDASPLVGPMKQSERGDALKCDVVWATAKLAKEGLDRPELDTLALLTPGTDPAWLQQAYGRILRSHLGKQRPTVLAFEDVEIRPMSAKCDKVRRWLKSQRLRWQITYNYGGEEHVGHS